MFVMPSTRLASMNQLLTNAPPSTVSSCHFTTRIGGAGAPGGADRSDLLDEIEVDDQIGGKLVRGCVRKADRTVDQSVLLKHPGVVSDRSIVHSQNFGKLVGI